MSQPTFDPIDRAVFRQRIQNNFSSGYLTMISIIEGVSFGILTTKTAEAFAAGMPKSYIIYPMMSFSTIVITFYFYSYFVSVLYTLPYFRETAIPLCLAATQVAPMFFLNDPKNWWAFFAVFTAFGGIAFHNTIRSLHPGLYAKDMSRVYTLNRVEILGNAYISAAISIVASVASLVHPSAKITMSSTLLTYDIVPFIFVLIVMIIMIMKSQLWYLPNLFKQAQMIGQSSSAD